MTEKFIPTHLLQIGTGKKRTYWRVQIVGPIGRGKVDKLLYYNAITSPRNKSGLHFIHMVPETRLRPIKQKEVAG
jgi:hypothetical protein